MSASILRKRYLLVFLAGFTIPTLQAQQPRTVSAQNALEAVRTRFGAESVNWISEIRGTGGQPQPLQWDILAYDAGAPGLLHHFRASSGLVQDGGPDNRRYPNDIPNGFFNIAKVGVDSGAAFTIAEAEARKARLGFDSCDYFLQLREFSNETAWKLDLVDANHMLVGSVFISGTNGEVLRTVWVQRGSISGVPGIIDSLSPSQQRFTGITNGNIPHQPVPETGIAGVSPTPPADRQNMPYAPVSPEGIIRRIPDSTTMTQPRKGSIFREFPIAGGGTTNRGTVLPPSNNPLDPTPPLKTPPTITIPVPEPQPIPIDPAITGPTPPINVPNNGGSAARIPPPPVPR